MNLNSTAIAGCLNYFRQSPPPFIRARSSLSPTPNYKIICATFSFKAQNNAMTGNSTAGIRVLCPTKWTVRADALLSIKNNYKVLLSTWEDAVQITKDTESKARIQGAHAQMKKFEFLFGVVLFETILRHTDNLSKTLKAEALSAAEGQEISSMLIVTLETLRYDTSFDAF